jgi:hypothetical protein
MQNRRERREKIQEGCKGELNVSFVVLFFFAVVMDLKVNGRNTKPQRALREIQEGREESRTFFLWFSALL